MTNFIKALVRIGSNSMFISMLWMTYLMIFQFLRKVVLVKIFFYIYGMNNHYKGMVIWLKCSAASVPLNQRRLELMSAYETRLKAFQIVHDSKNYSNIEDSNLTLNSCFKSSTSTALHETFSKRSFVLFWWCIKKSYINLDFHFHFKPRK